MTNPIHSRSLSPLLALLAVMALPACEGSREGTDRARSLSSILTVEEGSLRYTYHVVSGSEALFDVSEDPRLLNNLLPDRASDARRLRHRLEADLGVADLHELRKERRRDIEDLETLGYL